MDKDRSMQTNWQGKLEALQPNGYLFFHIPTLQKLADRELPKVPSIRLKKIDGLPIYNDIVHHPTKRLKSRRPVWEEATTEVDLQIKWKRTWLESGVRNSFMIEEDSTTKTPG